MRELAKESYVYTVQGKRKTVQRKDMGNFSIAVCDLPEIFCDELHLCKIHFMHVLQKFPCTYLDLAVESVDPLAFLEGNRFHSNI